MKKHLLQFIAAVMAFAFLALPASAQKGTYAITNAEVVTVSGSVISNGTVVVRDGLIEAVGSSVSIPADAKVIDAKGHKVYPGFFDTNTKLGLPSASPPTRNASGSRSGSISNYPPSLRAESDVLEKFEGTEAKFSSHRNAGFTTVVVGNSTGIFNGNSVVLNLAGENVSEMVVKAPFAHNIAFKTERGGVYPASLMGTFSAMRQMFHDAKRLDEIRKMYASNPKGIKRPEADATLDALIPVVRGEIPVVIFADTEREIIRALNITKEFNLKTIIAGARESGSLAEKLKAHNISVLLSVDFPMRKLAENKEADPEPLRTLRLRVEAPKAAAALKNAGVPFAFQSGGMKNIKDFVKNAAVATENGLSKEDAIGAMTISAAKILGVDAQLGSIEKGKIANLVVASGDILDKDSSITHVFVDGKLFEQPKKKKKPAKADGDGEAKEINAGGVWNVTVEPPGMSIPMTFNLTQSGDTITGTISSNMLGSATIRNGEVTEDGFAFDVTVTFQGTDLDLNVTGIINGDEVEGTVDTAQGPATFSGKRDPKN
ncbi:MAG: amidohydrolase family protein [Pyrinomonadaceae bacterium]|nr:amidohydrolase family protein [Pyrinomonadaceae bacterium]